MKKQLLTVVFVLGLSAAVAFAQAGASGAPAGSSGGAQVGGGAPAPAGASSDQQNPPMSEQMPGTTESKQSKKQSSMANVDDETLHRQVHEQLASNPDLQNVQIAVSNGVVTLDGTVPNKSDKKEAKKLAKSVPGVKSVKEHLTVSASAASAAPPSATGGVSGQTSAGATSTENPPSSQPSAGAVSGQAGATTSSTTGAATGETGQTSSTTGTTSGMGQTTPSTGTTTGMGQTTAGAATSTGSPCSSTSSQTATTGGDLASQIQSEICKDPNLASSNITVSQQSNQIILSGSVPSQDWKDKAADIAMRLASGQSVVNNIQVSGAGGTPPSTAGGISGSVGGAAPSSSSPAAGAGVSGQAGAAATPEAGATTSQPSVSGQAGVGAQTPESGATGAAAGATTGAQAGSQMSTADEQLRTQIDTALRQEPTLSNDNINVNLTSDSVELSGTVANGKDRQTAKRIAESFAGNRKVVDHLTVSGEGKGNVPPDKQ